MLYYKAIYFSTKVAGEENRDIEIQQQTIPSGHALPKLRVCVTHDSCVFISNLDTLLIYSRWQKTHKTRARTVHREWVSVRWSVRFALLIWLSLLYLPFSHSRRENAAQPRQVCTSRISCRAKLRRDLVIRNLEARAKWLVRTSHFVRAAYYLTTRDTSFGKYLTIHYCNCVWAT